MGTKVRGIEEEGERTGQRTSVMERKLRDEGRMKTEKVRSE